MRLNVKVKTEHGVGEIVKPEKQEGILNYRYLIKLDVPETLCETLKKMHDDQGGLYYMMNEFKEVK